MPVRAFTSRADSDTLVEFKATAVLRRITLHEAFTQAMQEWMNKNPQRVVTEKNFSETSQSDQQNS